MIWCVTRLQPSRRSARLGATASANEKSHLWSALPTTVRRSRTPKVPRELEDHLAHILEERDLIGRVDCAQSTSASGIEALTACIFGHGSVGRATAGMRRGLAAQPQE